MEQEKVDRINALAKKARACGLTEEEQKEQALLRQEYCAAIRSSLTAQLENTYVVDAQGSRHKLKRKKD